MRADGTVKTQIEEKCATIGHWNFPSSLGEGRTTQTQPSVGTQQRESVRRPTRRGNCDVLEKISSILSFTVPRCYAWCRIHIVAHFVWKVVWSLIILNHIGSWMLVAWLYLHAWLPYLQILYRSTCKVCLNTSSKEADIAMARMPEPCLKAEARYNMIVGCS